MTDSSKQTDWTKPAAMAIPKGGFFKDKVEQGRYGPIFPKSPACYGFTLIAKVIPGREENLYEYARNLRSEERRVGKEFELRQLQYLRKMLFDINKKTYFMYQGILDTD